MSLIITYNRFVRQGDLEEITDVQIAHRPLKKVNYSREFDHAQIIQGEDRVLGDTIANDFLANHYGEYRIENENGGLVSYGTNSGELYRMFSDCGITLVLV